MDSPDMDMGDAGAELLLEPILDIRAAAPLHRDLMARRGAPLVLGGRDVERVGGQCAAILLSAARSWAGDGHSFVVAEPSDGLRDGLELLGLDLSEIGGAAAPAAEHV